MLLSKTVFSAILATHAAALVIPSVQEVFDMARVQVDELTKVKVSHQLPIVGGGVDKFNPQTYIVVFDDNLNKDDIETHMVWLDMTTQMSPSGIYERVTLFHLLDSFSGYIGVLADDVVEELAARPGVKLVERDSVMHINEFDTQRDATWALARISHRELSPSTDYLYDNDGGKGVTAYVIDTGIKTDHEEFEGRASWGDAVPFPHLKVDGHGHGTHCAGIIGSKTYGVAKNVELVAVGVMNPLGSGTTSDIIKGVEFVVNDHREKVSANKKGFKGSTINMSIGGGASEALDLAVNAAVKAGIHVAVAAGNEDADACGVSPARASGPITVGASDNADARASFSNWGSCVDVFAPGVDILSTFTWSETTLMSGTSMASPHVAGLLSYFVSLQPEPSSEYGSGLVDPASLKKKLLKYSTSGVITGLDPQSPNKLIYNGAGQNLTDLWA